MKKTRSSTTTVNELGDDLLITIFMLLNVVDLSSVSLVCKSWREACSNPILWNKVDLSEMSSYFNIPKKPGVWRSEHSSARLTQFLKNALDLSQGKINCLIFNYFVYIRDVHLISAAERTPNLKRLVLPGSGLLSKEGVYHAMQFWRGLKSMTITSSFNHPYIFSAIGKYCKNLSELKITCRFEEDLAASLIKHTPNLKVLSLRRMWVNLNALSSVLNSLEHLEKVNICHSHISHRPNPNPSWSRMVRCTPRELTNHLSPSCMRKLIICQRRSCIVCKNWCYYDSLRRQHQQNDLLEVFWREDDIPSLAH